MVVDPVAREVTHLVVEPAHRSGLARLVPLDQVEEPGNDPAPLHHRGVREARRCRGDRFPPGRQRPRGLRRARALLLALLRIDVEGGTDPSLAMASGIVTRDLLPRAKSGYAVASASTRPTVRSARSKGLSSTRQGHVTHVLLQEGHLWGRKQVAIPVSAVQRIDDGVTVSLTKHEIESLPAVDLVGPSS